MNAQQALSKAMRQAKRLRADPVFLRFYSAAIVGCAGQYERRKEGSWPEEKYFADPERCDLLARRALTIAVSAWEQLFQDTEAACELFNCKLNETQSELVAKGS